MDSVPHYLLHPRTQHEVAYPGNSYCLRTAVSQLFPLSMTQGTHILTEIQRLYLYEKKRDKQTQNNTSFSPDIRSKADKLLPSLHNTTAITQKSFTISSYSNSTQKHFHNKLTIRYLNTSQAHNCSEQKMFKSLTIVEM